MGTQLKTWLVAGTLAIASVAAAQNPLPPTDRPVASPELVTVEGCLMREADVPGRLPRTPAPGVTSGYVLARAKTIKGSPPASLSGMYEVAGIDDGQLASYVGQRVQIDGWFDAIDRSASPSSRGASSDLVDIRGSAIRAIAKDCAN